MNNIFCKDQQYNMVEIVKYYLVNVALVASGSSLSLPKVLLCLKNRFKLYFLKTVAIFFGKFYFFFFFWNKAFTFLRHLSPCRGVYRDG